MWGMEHGEWIEGSERGSGETNVRAEIRSERHRQTVEGQGQREQVSLVGRVVGK